MGQRNSLRTDLSWSLQSVVPMVIPPMLTVVLHTMRPFVGGGAPQHANVSTKPAW